MTASNVGARTQAWQAKWAVFKIPGFVCKRFLPFSPTPSPLFYLRHFSRGLWLSFLVPLAPKPHGNACYTGYPYLEVALDNKMRWSQHIELISSRANNVLGLIKRDLWNCPKSVKETAYTTLVRPKLQYAGLLYKGPALLGEKPL